MAATIMLACLMGLLDTKVRTRSVLLLSAGICINGNVKSNNISLRASLTDLEVLQLAALNPFGHSDEHFAQ